MHAAGVRDLREHFSSALRSVAKGETRIVVRRHRQLLAALVPMPDYWLLVELEEELARRGWRRGVRLRAADVAAAMSSVAGPAVLKGLRGDRAGSPSQPANPAAGASGTRDGTAAGSTAAAAGQPRRQAGEADAAPGRTLQGPALSRRSRPR